MKKITLFLLLCTFIGKAQVTTYNVGDVVDDFTVTDTDGNVYNLYTLTAQGKYVWLDFFFVDCVPCQGSAPIFNEFHDKYGCNAGDVFALSINNGNDNNARVRQYHIDHGGPFNHAPAISNEGGGPAVDANFGVNAYPTFCLIGPGNVLLNKDIWPLSGVETFENSFPQGFEPEVMECITVGIDEAHAFNFSIYPTVSKGNVSIKLPGILKSSVVIFNTLGQQVFTNNYSEENISLKLHLSPGIYMVKVVADNNSLTKRIIIE
ncbi:T9SS type A sorting domain-containing protein [Aequorivita sp. SDUM287046]|uniref:T9SS type A sorting domain-containing protein n=1 Tax=Aequorivita aurantiaca TaxID=3053356 RepID=A0ABT8DL39_9FLAO|nr:T9SS type A sorting domain-containing protein [Aequorivita aurantiaca]MDN3723860.1 T9SS type A sorting domain-containing protein [Aequorivita aurantiaca]